MSHRMQFILINGSYLTKRLRVWMKCLTKQIKIIVEFNGFPQQWSPLNDNISLAPNDFSDDFVLLYYIIDKNIIHAISISDVLLNYIE